MASITLEQHAVASQGAHLCTGLHDIEDPDFQLSARPIVLEERAWVAAEAFVGPGVTIHQGAVLGARGVLFKDAEAWGVYVGNPAVLIRKRDLKKT
jgi:putative colanic acid biosynthesis acetyltransferase WcaF